MEQVNLSKIAGKQASPHEGLICAALGKEQTHNHLIFFSVLNIFFSVVAFLGNTLILVALHKESSLHLPSKLLYRYLAATDLLTGLIAEPFQVVYGLSLIHENWTLCRYALAAHYFASLPLSSVSLLTMTAISVDRLFALLLSFRYRHVVTLKRTYVIIVIFWVVSIVAGISYIVSYRIGIWYNCIFLPVCLATSTISYTKVFRTLRHRQNQMKAHVQQKPSQPVPLNMLRYRKAVYSALWVHLALVVSYLPYSIAVAVLTDNGLTSLSLTVWAGAISLVYLNSSLNPFLYYWKINEVRRAVKETTRGTLCCPRN